MLLNEKILSFYNQLDRSLFMEKNQSLSHEDIPLPIGYGQTISQPSLVLKMTQMLNLFPSARTLEIGTGSGYQTALLAEFSQEVFTIERIPELFYKAENRLKLMGYPNIRFKLDDGSIGWKEFSPFDRILVTAAAKHIPQPLIDQLNSPGLMVLPVGKSDIQQLTIVFKNEKGDVRTESHGAVRFVPLLGRY